MKILQKVQKQFALVGISPSSDHSTELFNKKIFVGFFLYGYPIVSQIIYIVQVANGFIEYVECVCATAASTIVFVCFASIVLRKAAVFKLIDDVEKLIDTSKKPSYSSCHFLDSIINELHGIPF